MYFTFACPHCGKKLKVREEAAGRKAGCPYCKASVVVPSPPAPSEPTEDDLLKSLQGIGETQQSAKVAGRARRQKQAPPSGRKSAGVTGAERTDVSITRSALLGTAIAAAFLVAVFLFGRLPVIGYLSELFFQRGWVPFALALFMGWSIAILMLKYGKLKRQRASMLFDLLPSDIAEEITDDNVDKFVANIHGLPVEPGESFLVSRVLRGLEHFRVRKSNPEVASMLASHSEIDANAVQSSYTLLNVFIWAIPILGFIGTVIGIGAAVGAFSGSLEAAQDISVLKQSLNQVTGGLATAFDTTLVALVMSIFVMFPSSSLQKAEEDLLNWVDEYCNENLLKRLNDGGDLADVQDTTKIRKAFDAALAPHHAELRAWGEKFQSIGTALTQQVAEGWGQINRRIEERQTETLEQIKDLDAMAAAFLQTMTRLAEQTEAVHQQAAGSMGRSAESMTAYCTALGQGIAGLNDVLGKLGEKQVVVHTQPRRGWFFRRNSKKSPQQEP
jgi:biopolymer transport protein ExbB/TolQ/DNA-directed RNA polymerase subunit RPC12/RpoP